MRRIVLVGAVVALCGLGCGVKTCPSSPGCRENQTPSIQKVTCNVTRTECGGWQEAFDGSIQCASFVQRQISGAVGCVDMNGRTATQACRLALCDPLSMDYPLNSLANPQFCNITSASSAAPSTGECGPVTAVGNSGDRFDDCLDCTQNGRICAQTAGTSSGGQICINLPEYTDSVTARYADLSGVPGLDACRNQSLTFPGSSVGNLVPIQFPFMQLRSVTPNVPQGGSSVCGVRPLAAPLTAAYAFAGGGAGSLAMAGQTTAPLTLGGGFATVGQLCFGEICQTELSKLRLVLGDVTFAGLTLHNTQIETTRPRSLSGGSIPAGGASFEVAVDVAGLGRAMGYVSNSSTLTVARTQSTIRVTGSLDYLARTSINTYTPLTLSIDVSGTADPAAGSCGTATGLANLLGFETTLYWTSQAPLSVTASRKTQGCFALQVGGSGYRTVNSVPFVTPLPGVTSTIGLDVFIPSGQPNPSWLGAVQLYLTCPSAGVYNAYIGQVELTGKPQGAFSTASFPVPSPLVGVLNTAHPDCSFSAAVNMNQTPESPVLDNLRFM